jgi:hypothetical protein
VHWGGVPSHGTLVRVVTITAVTVTIIVTITITMEITITTLYTSAPTQLVNLIIMWHPCQITSENKIGEDNVVHPTKVSSLTVHEFNSKFACPHI